MFKSSTVVVTSITIPKLVFTVTGSVSDPTPVVIYNNSTKTIFLGASTKNTCSYPLPSKSSISFGGIFGTLYSGGYVQCSGKSHIISGTGAPALAGAKGDLYIRRTATTTNLERLYICKTTGAGATKWVGVA